ncbi:Transcriptional regulator, contains XRE-family HTH domain [Shimia gijangensis]|uniref:Transcriptional regulator, contains XRE-family HTH domain n=1 Tax=Shimia gijangensis TaxID=1470563 RepID=A0A1M6DV71_9RHOB|nr:helix-turn-helix transcriptional regulator [Shimia gijangensis]SHI77065.1 Transcriptional regulator, contains XRE-family HTH domain [Shimia gijangensis]
MADDFTDETYDDYWYGDDVATFGDRLAAAREYAGLSQEEFSRRLGVKISTARGWEDDLNEPRANKLQMMAGLLNVSVVWLLMGEGEGVVSAPAEDEGVTAPNLSGLLVEIRDIRAQMKNNLDHLARLEKKLRLAVKETMQND